MQMKMVKVHQKFDKKKIRSLLEKENEFITNLFVNLEVPESIDGKQQNDKQYCFFFYLKVLPSSLQVFVSDRSQWISNVIAFFFLF